MLPGQVVRKDFQLLDRTTLVFVNLKEKKYCYLLLIMGVVSQHHRRDKITLEIKNAGNKTGIVCVLLNLIYMMFRDSNLVESPKWAN